MISNDSSSEARSSTLSITAAAVILYLDTSAFMPLLIDEPTSATCGALWVARGRCRSSRH